LLAKPSRASREGRHFFSFPSHRLFGLLRLRAKASLFCHYLFIFKRVRKENREWEDTHAKEWDARDCIHVLNECTQHNDQRKGLHGIQCCDVRRKRNEQTSGLHEQRYGQQEDNGDDVWKT